MGLFNRKEVLDKPVKPASTRDDGKAAGKTADTQGSILQGVIDSYGYPIYSIDRNYCYTSFNKSQFSVTKSIYGAEIQLGKNLLDYISIQSDRERVKANIDLVLAKGETVNAVYSTDKLLSPRFNQVSYLPTVGPTGEVHGVLVIAGDISGQKQIEEKLRERAHGLDERIKELNCLYELSRLIEEKDNSLEDIFKGAPGLIPGGWQYPEITCARLTVENKEFATPNWQETAGKQGSAILVNGVPVGRLEVGYLQKMPDSFEGPFLKEERDLVDALAQRLGKVIERKQTEGSILHSKLLLQSVIDATPDFIYVKDFEHRFILVNRSFAQSQNLEPREMIGRPDTDFFSEEVCLGNPEKGIAGFHADDLQAFQGQLVQNPGTHVTWADGSVHIYDTYKIPLTDQSGKIYAAMVFGRDSTERQKAEEKGEAASHALQRTLQSFIDAVADVTEIRDPYTAGHQRRAATLAAAIAREMELDDSRIENLVMAAKIHDIGKMYVPADILSKPGKLTDIEFSMIITHAQGSYDILWKAEFSQPVALIVLQHHERIDGSGYPNGLKGEQMLTESRILAVADVVEAIASNRPYRTTFGIERALDEISNHRGELYDSDVVDACLKLFNEKGFKLQ